MEIIGRNIELGVGVEKIRGTAQLTAEKWIKNVRANILARAEHAMDDNSHNVLEDSDNRRVVKKWIEGDLEGIVQADVIGYFLYNLYGAVSSDVVSGSVYDHTFSIAQSIEHATLTLFAKDGGVLQKSFNNGVVNNLEITAVLDDFVRFTAGIRAVDENSNSDSPSYDTEYDFIGKDITIKVADTEGGLSGATATKLKELNITFDAGSIIDHILSSYTPDDIYNSKFSIEGSFVKNYDDTTFKDLYQGDSAKYMSITIQGSQDIGGGSNPTITITLHKVKITDWDRSGDNDDLVTENVSFKAFYNASDSKQSALVLRNLTSEYDTPVSD